MMQPGTFPFVFRKYINLCLVLFLITLALSTCTKEELIDAPQPIRDKIALMMGSDCFCLSYIDKYIWRNKTVYFQLCKGPSCNCYAIYYDENGNAFKMDDGYTWMEFRTEAQFVKNVWSCVP